MARDHARIHVSIWHNPDFRALSASAQHAYFTIISQPGLSYAGVLDYFPTRIAALSAGNTPRRVAEAVTKLHTSRFIIVDERTAELLVRTYVRHDGVLGRVNMGKAVARAYGRVMSLDLRRCILTELAKAHRDDPNAQGWVGFSELEPEAMLQVIDQSAAMQSPMASGM